MQAICIVSACAQAVIEPSAENLLATTFAFIGSTILIQYLIHSKCAHERPISALALVGLNVTSLLTSMAAMSIYGRPLIENLRAPELTFPILAVVHIAAVLAHWIYINFSTLSNTSNIISKQFFSPLGLFSTPHIATVWTMGAIGATSQFLGNANTGDVSGKAIQALGFLCWMPFLIPFYYLQSGEKFCKIHRQAPLILVFIALLVFVGLANNVRQIMMIGPLQLIFAYFFYLAITKAEYQKNTMRNYIGGVTITVFAIYIATDLVTAMGVARDKRETGTTTEIIEETFNALFVDRHKLTDYRARTDLAATLAVYDEAYIPNPILTRLSETKFHDNMLFFGSNFVDENKEGLLEGMENLALATLPADLAETVRPGFDKSYHIYSAADYYLYLLWGESRLSSFVTGSIWADFYTLTGAWFFVLIIPYIWLILIAMDSLSTRGNKIQISAIAVCTSWQLFIYGIGGTSIIAKAAFFLREIPQRIFLYLLVFWTLYLLMKVLNIKQPSDSST